MRSALPVSLLLVVLLLGGCDFGAVEPLPSPTELQAAFDVPAPGSAIIREGSLDAGRDETVTAQVLGGFEGSDPYLYITFCQEGAFGVTYEDRSAYDSLVAGLELNAAHFGFAGDEGTGTVYITAVSEEGEVSGVFATDVYDKLGNGRRRIQGAFSARRVEETYTCPQ